MPSSNDSSYDVNHAYALRHDSSTLLTLASCCRGVRSSQQQCSTCHTMLPTPYLLSLHVSEQHDSFFASQAAQRMPVFQCLVEGCNSTFCLAAQRHQHLSDFHQIPTDSGFDRYGPLTIYACKIVHTLLHATWLYALPCDTLAACSLGLSQVPTAVIHCVKCHF